MATNAAKIHTLFFTMPPETATAHSDSGLTARAANANPEAFGTQTGSSSS